MSREEALQKLKEPPYTEEIEDDFEYVANKLEISTQELKTLMTKENKSFRDYRSNYQLINFFTKIARWTGSEKRIIQ